ncbi:hypothetical protein TGPRC2_238880A, partial [Toxoplasma gondii TgCatPRC2]
MEGAPRQSLGTLLQDRGGRRSRRSSDNETVLDSSFSLFPPSPVTGPADSAQGRMCPSLPASPQLSSSQSRLSALLFSLPSSLPSSAPRPASLESLADRSSVPLQKKQGVEEGERGAGSLASACEGQDEQRRGSLEAARSHMSVSSIPEQGADSPNVDFHEEDAKVSRASAASRERRTTVKDSPKDDDTALSFPDPPSSPGARFSVSRASSPSLASRRSRSPDTQLPFARRTLSCSSTSASRSRASVGDARLFSSSACSRSSPPLSPPGETSGTPLLRPTADPPSSAFPSSTPFSSSYPLGPAVGLRRTRAISVHPSFPGASPPVSALERPRGASSLLPFSPPNTASDVLSPPPDLVLSPACGPSPRLKGAERPPAFSLLSPPMAAERRSGRRGSVPFSPPSACTDVLSPPPDLLSPYSPLPPLLKESEKPPGGRLGGQGDRSGSSRGVSDAPQLFTLGPTRQEKPAASSFFFPPPPSPFGGNASVLRLGAWLAERPGLDDDRFTPLLESFLLHFDFLAAGKVSRRIQQDQQIQRDLRLGEDEEGEVSFFRPVGRHTDEKSEQTRTGKREEDRERKGQTDQLEEFETTLLDILSLRGGNGVHTSVDILVGQLREKPHRHKAAGEEGGGEPAGGTTGGIRIGEKFFFADKVALKSRLRQILQACDDEEELRGDDFELVKGVLEFHPKAKRKMQ